MPLQHKQKHRGLDWLRPGKSEVAIVGKYVADQGPKLHPAFGGSSELDVEHARFVNVQPYRRLEDALKDYIPTLSIEFTTFDNDLSDRIIGMEKAYEDTKQGFWQRLWYRMGDEKEIVSAWLDLIPNEYGLSVIRAGIAVVFKLAENYKEGREKVRTAFSRLRKAADDLKPARARFPDSAKVSDAAGELRQGILKAVEDLVLALAPKTPFWTKFAGKLKRGSVAEEDRPKLDTVLDTLDSHIERYNYAIGMARDDLHLETAAYSRLAATETVRVNDRLDVIGDQVTADLTYVRRMADDAAAYRENRHRQEKRNHEVALSAMRGGYRELQLSIARGNEEVLGEFQAVIKTTMMELIISIQEQTAIGAELAALRRTISHGTKRTAIVSLDHLCLILARPLSAYNPDKPPNLSRMFQHPSTDLRLALTKQSQFSPVNQGQVQSLLTHPQFLQWMSNSHPSLLFVDANIRESSRDRLSAISVFCSTLITSLTQVYPDAVVIHFFCGLHSAPELDWCGPNGLVRSLIMQLLMKLDEKDPDMQSWNLDFINDRGFLRDLEQHCLDDLCKALHWLLYEFPLGTHVYCIIDGISCFAVSRLLKDLHVVMERLRGVVDDQSLVPVFKVLLTNPGTSTPEVKNMTLFKEDPARLVSLGRQHLGPGRIMGRVVENHLLRAPSPMGRRTRSPFRDSRGPSPAVSVRRRIDAPVPVVREVFSDQGEDGYVGEYWDGDDGSWNY